MSKHLENPVHGPGRRGGARVALAKAAPGGQEALDAFEAFAASDVEPAARKVARVFREGAKALPDEGLIALYLGAAPPLALTEAMAAHALEGRRIFEPVLVAAFEATAPTAGPDPGVVIRETEDFQRRLFGSSLRGLATAAPILTAAHPATQDADMLRGLYGLDSRLAEQGAKYEAGLLSKGLLGQVAAWAGRKLVEKMLGQTTSAANRAWTAGKVNEQRVVASDLAYMEKWVTSRRGNVCRECQKLEGALAFPGAGFYAGPSGPMGQTADWALNRTRASGGIRPGWHPNCACQTVMVDARTGSYVAG